MWRGSILFIGFLLPIAVHANGGIKEVAEGKYMVNVSGAPIAPYVGQKQGLLIAFADIYGNLLLEDISVDLTLKYLQQPIFERKNLVAEDGVLPFKYTYDKSGIYELFVQFRLPEEPDHTYMPEDFMIDVKEKYTTAPPSSPVFPAFMSGLAGLFIGFVLGKRSRHLPILL